MVIHFVLIASALLYAAAYWFPTALWWGACVSMVPLFMLQGSVSQYLGYGILWGLIAYGLQLWGVIAGIVSLAFCNTWQVWCIGIVLVIYLAVWTGCIWSCGAWGIATITQKYDSFFLWCIWWSNWFAFYWYLFSYHIFIVLDRFEGCLFFNPVVPFAAYPLLLKPIVYIGVVGYTTLCCYGMGIFAYICMCRSYTTKIVMSSSMVLLFFCIAHYIKHCSVQEESSVSHIVGIPKWIGYTDELEPACRLLCQYITEAIGKNKKANSVVFPESSVSAWRVCTDVRIADFMHDDMQMVQNYVIGSFYDDNGQYRNSCYWFRNGILQKRFDKRHAMPLIERIPKLLQWCSWIRSLFFNTMPEIVPSDNERPLIMIGNMYMVPYICSELFFNKEPDDKYYTAPILALVNDRWCSYEYVKNLMYLGAVVQAYAWKRSILYISYSRSMYIVHY